MSDWHSNPLITRLNDDIDAIHPTTSATDVTQTTEVNSPNETKVKHISPQQLGQYAETSISKIPPYEYFAKQVFSNASPFSVRLGMSRQLYVTNGEVEGRFEITCAKESPQARIGKIHVYLVGIEGINQYFVHTFLLSVDIHVILIA